MTFSVDDCNLIWIFFDCGSRFAQLLLRHVFHVELQVIVSWALNCPVTDHFFLHPTPGLAGVVSIILVELKMVSSSIGVVSSGIGVLLYSVCSAVMFSSMVVNLPPGLLAFPPPREWVLNIQFQWFVSFFRFIFFSFFAIVCLVPAIAVCGFWQYIFSNLSRFRFFSELV